MLEKHYYKLNFSNIQHFWDIHTTLEKDLDLFEYYGDLQWITVVNYNGEVVKITPEGLIYEPFASAGKYYVLTKE